MRGKWRAWNPCRKGGMGTQPGRLGAGMAMPTRAPRHIIAGERRGLRARSSASPVSAPSPCVDVYGDKGAFRHCDDRAFWWDGVYTAAALITRGVDSLRVRMSPRLLPP